MSPDPPRAAPAQRFRGGIAVLSGPSGSGKTSVCHALLEDPRVDLSVSATTRAPRAGEREGVDYHFLTRDRFERQVAAGGFVEWAEVYGNLYGTLRAPLEEACRRRDRLLLLDIDVQGAAQLREQGIAAIYLFIAPPSLDELRRRLEGRRRDAPEDIERRLQSAAHEMSQQSLYDLVIVNRDLDETIDRAREVLGLLGTGPFLREPPPG